VPDAQTKTLHAGTPLGARRKTQGHSDVMQRCNIAAVR
jgi:hypothetical protein